MKKETVYYPLAVMFALCGLVAAISCSEQILRLSLGMGGSILGGLFLWLGVAHTKSDLENRWLQLCDQKKENLKILSSDFRELKDTVAVLNQAMEAFHQENRKAMEDIMNRLDVLQTNITECISQKCQDLLAMLDSNQKQNSEFQNALIEEISDINQLLKTGNDYAEQISEALGRLTDLSERLKEIKVGQSKMAKCLEDALDDVSDELSDNFRALEQASQDQADAYRETLKTYSDITAQDAEILKEFLNQREI